METNIKTKFNVGDIVYETGILKENGEKIKYGPFVVKKIIFTFGKRQNNIRYYVELLDFNSCRMWFHCHNIKENEIFFEKEVEDLRQYNGDGFFWR